MGFSHWLRQNSEHYLLIDAQRQMAKKYGRSPPQPEGWRDRFWLDVFAPTYRRLPWQLRRFTIQLMPGSHRKVWHQPARRGSPAVGADGRIPGVSRPPPSPAPSAPLPAPAPVESQPTESRTQPSAEPQTVPETRGE